MILKKLAANDTVGRAFNLANNGITLFGIVLTTISALMIITFVLVELARGFHNPYVGIIAFVILPAFFVLGLLLIPIGMVLRRRRLLAAGATDEEMAHYPRLDFNDPRLRKVGAFVLGLTALNGVIMGTSSFLGVEHMESVEFCGTTCHVVMQPEFTAYQQSPHSRVACVQCHIGPGASWFVRSKLDGLRQVWHTALGDYSRPIETPLKDLRPARETCEQCHWPTKHHGDKLKIFARFAADETNTPSYTAMLMKTGGGSLDMGTHGGIHWWHIASDNVIRFVTGDERREEVVWVELTTPEGEVRTYSRDFDDLPSAETIRNEARIMDCIDCHNRPTHLFEPPAKALDGLLEARPELRQLPFFKKQALALISAGYDSHDAGMATVERELLSYYRTNDPETWRSHQELVKNGAAEAAQVYGRIFFPEMNTDWESHPNHIGHDDFPGCWRCHDGEMTTRDEEHYIPVDCENCHVFLVEDAEKPPVLADLIG